MRRTWRAAVAALALSPPAAAMDLTAFVAAGGPQATWGQGYGGSLGARLLGLVTLEGEAMRLPVEAATPSGSVTAFTASVLISPPLDLIVPYGGLGVGLYRQSFRNVSDTGRLSALVLGIRAKLGPAFARAEFRSYTLPEDALLPLEKRYSLGVGITF